MCGILGQYSFSKNPDSSILGFQRGLDALNHRGPDSNLIHNDGQLILGHTRLSVIDKSPESNQPYCDSRYSLVYNGEIYNHKNLRKELESLEVSFQTQSDTEVLFKALIQWGQDALPKLNGQFAFAFYDNQEDELLIVRDRFGIKPLWFHKDDTNLSFSSELRALSLIIGKQELDGSSLKSYFQNTYISAPNSIYKAVSKIQPGEFLRLKKGVFHQEIWYKSSNKNIRPKQKNTSQELRELLQEAVEDRMIADVPLGCFLSGGLDSSIVASLASQHKTDIHTFSIGFADQAYLDETRYAEIMANKIGSQHHSFRLKEDDLLENLNEMLMALSEPFADSSALAVYILSKKTKEFVTVALSGDGADEIFGGYNKHKALARLINPGAQEKLVNSLSNVWKVAPKSRENYFKNKMRQFDRFSSMSKDTLEDQYHQLTSFTDEMYLKDLLLLNSNGKIRILDFSNRKDVLNAILVEDQGSILPNDMLTKMDSMSMANSLEVRTPFLDHRVVEYANSLPSELKFNKNLGKIILREAFRDDLPEEIIHRSKKGFEIPTEYWLRTALKNQVMELCKEDRIREQGLFSWEKVNELSTLFYKSNNSKLTAYMWAMFVFQRWIENQG